MKFITFIKFKQIQLKPGQSVGPVAGAALEPVSPLLSPQPGWEIKHLTDAACGH